ncbi:NAD(+) diphosphatase [Seongchinamella sediminis]|uniref:NAD(+) diphosphatase n=1 Tax=Seongchinamella sediminis TaxID=2283635 RepID=A0A3L7E0B9_9GAMM|nr:NAD(+) diphosphatase [Seongchinamella sediminis]RLQ22956.1 NAD(+) diphosphatase [Seongchinamella sediminis]
MFRPDNQAPDSPANALHIVFQNGKLVSNMRSSSLCLLEQTLVEQGGWQVRKRHFMGYWREQPCFAVEIDASHQLDPMDYQLGSLWQILGRVDEPLFSLAGRAAQVLAWERDHQFCGRCGSPMRPHPAERAMVCEPCGMTNYPRIAPCIIVLVTRGEEMLLARAANNPRPMYSTLAGFIEAGETAEETLVREVREEVGLEVGALRYFQSQSWPFPNQLMLGYFAEYAGGEIVCEPGEIADAQWFHPHSLPMIPPPASVAGQLIQHHLQSLS